MTNMNEIISTDIIVAGSGIAGLTAALHCAKFADVLLICKGKLNECNTSKAQGGIAVSVLKNDSPKIHFYDTVKTGAGLSDEKAVRALTEQSKNMLKELQELGVKFDKKNSLLDLRIEGAHSKARIVHIKGDYTGREIEEILIRNVKKNKNIKIIENQFLMDLIIEKNKCYGVYVLDEKDNKIKTCFSAAVLLATGGVGQIYKHTSNSITATGDGIAASYRAGAYLVDLEFVQFHPTAIYMKSSVQALPEHLVTETLRGEGAVLVDKHKKPFMEKYSLRADLSSRDIVSRSIFKEMYFTKTDYVFLDISRVKNFHKKFPQIVAICKKLRIDLSKKLIPVIPTAHYFMGGIKVNISGKTNIKGLFAAGEAACTGVHGANRLASNSLSEGYVFGKLAAREIGEYLKSVKRKALSVKRIVEKIAEQFFHRLTRYERRDTRCVKDITTRLKDIMWKYAGVFRCGKTMQTGLKEINKLSKKFEKINCKELAEGLFPAGSNAVKFFELRNMLLLAKLIIQSALKRRESRGSHFRTDFPERNDKAWKKHIVVAGR